MTCFIIDIRGQVIFSTCLWSVIGVLKVDVHVTGLNAGFHKVDYSLIIN